MENERSEKDFGEDKQKKYVMHCMTHILQQECRGILEYKIICKKKACERISHRSSIFNAL